MLITKKVKIIKCTDTSKRIEGYGYAPTQFSDGEYLFQRIIGMSGWYDNKINTVWEVIDFNEQYYRVNNKSGCGFYMIKKKDVEYVNE